MSRKTMASPELINSLAEHELKIELKYDKGRSFYLIIDTRDFQNGQRLPRIFINPQKKVKKIEWQTMQLV